MKKNEFALVDKYSIYLPFYCESVDLDNTSVTREQESNIICNFKDLKDLKDDFSGDEKIISFGTLSDLIEEVVTKTQLPITIELLAPLTESVIQSISDAFLSSKWPPGSRILVNLSSVAGITLDLLKKLLDILQYSPPNLKFHFCNAWNEIINESGELDFLPSQSLPLIEKALLHIPSNFTFGINRIGNWGIFTIQHSLFLAEVIKKIASPGFVLELTEDSNWSSDTENELKQCLTKHKNGPSCILIAAALSNPNVVGLNIRMALGEVDWLMKLLAKNNRKNFELNIILDGLLLDHTSAKRSEIHVENLLNLLIYVNNLRSLQIQFFDINLVQARKLLSILPNNKQLKYLNFKLENQFPLSFIPPGGAILGWCSRPNPYDQIKNLYMDILTVRPDMEINGITYEKMLKHLLSAHQPKKIKFFCFELGKKYTTEKYLTLEPDMNINVINYEKMLQQFSSDHKLKPSMIEQLNSNPIIFQSMQENATIKSYHFLSIMRRPSVDYKESGIARLALPDTAIHIIYSFINGKDNLSCPRFYFDCRSDSRLIDSLGYLALLYYHYPKYIRHYQTHFLDGVSLKAMLITCFFENLNIKVKKDQVVLDALKRLFTIGEWTAIQGKAKDYRLKLPQTYPEPIVKKIVDLFNHCFLGMIVIRSPGGKLYLRNVTILSLMSGYFLHRQTLEDFIATTASVVTSPVPTPLPSSTTQASGIDVPADGNCFYWSVALACLLEARLDRIRFNQMYQRLFGEVKTGSVGSSLLTSSEIKRNHVYSKLSATSLNLKDIFKDPVISSLVCSVFRKRVIAQAARSFNDPQRLIAAQAYGRVSWEEYAKVAEQPGTFAGHTELILASHVLNRKLIIYSNGRCYQVGEAKAEGSEIKLCHVNAQGRQNGALNHFRFVMDEKLIMAPQTTQPVRSVGVSAPSASGSMILMPSQSSKDKIKHKRKASDFPKNFPKKPSDNLNYIFK